MLTIIKKPPETTPLTNVEINILSGMDAVTRTMAFTQGKTENEINMTLDKFYRLLLSEHSPIRAMKLEIAIYNIPYYCAMHYVRHTGGTSNDIHDIDPLINWFVRSQRDYAHPGYDRKEAPQSALVNIMGIMNPQNLIDISKKRLCGNADDETRKIWQLVKVKIANHYDMYVRQIAKVMLPTCEYRGGRCYELKCCGLHERIVNA